MTVNNQCTPAPVAIPIRLASTTAEAPSKLVAGDKPSQKNEVEKFKAPPDEPGDDATSLIHISIYLFRGQPDAYYNRHVIAYFTSPDNPDFHETVHTQRDTEWSPWVPKRESGKIDWVLVVNYLGHINAGTIQVSRGQEMTPVSIVASANVQGRETDSGWNCQHFLLEGLQKLVDNQYQTQAWYDDIEEDLTDMLLDEAVP